MERQLQDDNDAMRVSGEIGSVADLLELLVGEPRSGENGTTNITGWRTEAGRVASAESTAPSSYCWPFGIWYRGQSCNSWKLTPGAFRRALGDGKWEIYNETNMFYHFKLRAAKHGSRTWNAFDWLCLMQHYELPTRLLDWSESPLVALYFAVSDPNVRDQHGMLYALHAQRLNACTSHHQIAVPGSFNVLLRSECTRFRTLEDLLRSNILKSCDENDMPSDWPTAKEKAPDALSFLPFMGNPIAVLPARTNDRMISQYSTFTIHGGKVSVGKDGVATDTEHVSWLAESHSVPQKAEAIPPPKCLIELNVAAENQEFLVALRIPAGRKERIVKELEALGIHAGTLFPEIDKQAQYVRPLWTTVLESPLDKG